MAIIVPIASGKGGVGKSVLAANLGVALAQAGKTTVLVDLDLGGANLHTLLGLKNRSAGIGGLVRRTETGLDGLVVETAVPKLHFIPGDTLLVGAANPEFYVKQRILRGLAGLTADFVVLDLGAGSAFNTVDFFLAAPSGLVVTLPEITAVLNAYSFIKTAAFRSLLRAFPAKSPERLRIEAFADRRIEGTADTLSGLRRSLAADYPATAPAALEKAAELRPLVVINQGESFADLAICRRLRTISVEHLGVAPEFIGFCPRDPAVPRSVAARRPVLLSGIDGPFARSVRDIAERLVERGAGPPPPPAVDDADLRAVAAPALGQAAARAFGPEGK
jgi:flagellar biosynthesis protein FlhG